MVLQQTELTSSTAALYPNMHAQSAVAAPWHAKLNPLKTKEVKVINSTQRVLVLYLSMDPNAVRVGKVDVGLKASGSGAEANLSVTLDRKIAGPVQKQPLSPSQSAQLRIDGSKAYLTVFAQTSRGYRLIIDKRLLNAHETFTVLPKHSEHSMGMTKSLP